MLVTLVSPSVHFSFTDPATTEIYTLSLHDALPISIPLPGRPWHVTSVPVTGPPRVFVTGFMDGRTKLQVDPRSEEHTSELQSQFHLVCRLLLEKKKKPARTTKTGR